MKAAEKYNLSTALGAIIDRAEFVDNKLTLVEYRAGDIHILDGEFIRGVSFHKNSTDSWYNIPITKPHHGVIQLKVAYLQTKVVTSRDIPKSIPMATIYGSRY